MGRIRRNHKARTSERGSPLSVMRHMKDDVIANMRGRIELCRRLAKSTHDALAAKMMSEMAEQIEADIRRLEGSTDETA